MITIPSRLRRILEKDRKLAASANKTLSTFDEWLDRNRLEFFPEYTDHGPKHITAVLATSEALIAEAAFRVLNARDAAAMVLATILHDCAMHLTEDGFVRLVSGKTDLKNVDYFDKTDKTDWPKLWWNFRSEVIRFSSSDNLKMFGNPDPVPFPELDDPQKWNKNQRLMVGEFIRRHHPRLAHEIALQGFPGAKGEVLKLDSGLDERLRDVIGLIARSHGIRLRPCIDYLEENPHRDSVEPQGVHAVFAMAVLRIADYLQIDAQRADRLQIRMQAIRSQLSIREWEKHHAVPSLTQHKDDPEAYRAKINEDEVKSIDTFLSLRRLLTDIQREIDDSWAVIGEVYGRLADRNGPLNRLGLMIRRLRSDLDDPRLLAALKFEPEELRFHSNGTQFFRLLIEPLYGGDTRAGVRELVQNSVDAIRELQGYLARHGETIGAADQPDLDADVVVDTVTRDDKLCLRVRDRGMGMSLEIVRDYYLNVGASYRQSAEWKSENTKDGQTSEILRTGYFGIGALAGFLLGDEIRVTTRRLHYRGLQFTASLDKDTIQVDRVHCPVGTTIEIPLRKELSAEWYDSKPGLPYYLAEPSVRIWGELPKNTYPGIDDEIVPASWQRLGNSGGPVVYWSRVRRYSARVAHNGFLVEHGDQDLRTLWSSVSRYGLRVLLPEFHILDRQGNRSKPYLNLSRSNFLQERFELLPDIFADVLADFLAYLLVMTDDPPHGGDWYVYSFLDHTLERLEWGYRRESARCMPVVYTPRGVAPFDAAVLGELGIRSVFLLHQSLAADMGAMLESDGLNGFLPANLAFTNTEYLSYPIKKAEPPAGLEVVGSRVLYASADMSGPERLQVFTRGNPPASGGLANAEFVQAAFGITLAPTETPKPLQPDSRVSAIEWSLGTPRVRPPAKATHRELIEAFAHRSVNEQHPSPLVLAWRLYLGDWLIPYDRKEREKELAPAYQALKPYIKAWQEVAAELEATDRESRQPGWRTG